ncbi:stage III sporulation protein AE [Pelosinus sp. IPA-1]|uniref:stage III sporulation protein AE n=1 Tax=Pelosinus sp. IPA-1 TaxID=3029569 RepID=UPI0024362492|nr:stage III sporulation protein AE [Pelosinus sp. IPA-1]GMA99181.1 stage III sporulation protein AE [Pelosinus sp. IPA-1]
MKIFIMAIVWLMISITSVFANPLNSVEIEQQLLEKVSPENINQFIQQVNQELNDEMPLLNSDTIHGIATQGLNVSWQHLRQSIIANFFHEITVSTHLMGKLLFLAVLCAMLQNLQNSFEKSSISLLAYSVCFIFMSSIALTAFYNTLKLASQTVGYMVGFMEALLPLLMSLLAGVGAITSASLFTPLMLFVISSMSVIVKDVVLPLLFLTAALECLNFLSDTYRLSNLASILKQSGMIILGFSMVIFIGVITIQGTAGSIADGLALRTAKFATATFIPVVGKMFADTVELVMGASLLLKNAVGIFGIIIVSMICILPLIKILSLILVIKISGALVQPLGDEKMAKCLDSIGNNLFLVFGAVLTVALMFFLDITMILAAGSAAMMLR